MNVAEAPADERSDPKGALPSNLRRRANRLARALQKMTLSQNSIAVISCCPAHKDDERVAAAAARSIGLTAFCVLDGWEWTFDSASAAVVLACAEGIDRVRSVSGVVVSDSPGTYWWRLLELRESPEALEVSASAAVA